MTYLALLRRFWKVGAGIALVLGLWLIWHNHGVSQYNTGLKDQQKFDADRETQYIKDHDAKIAKLDEDYHAQELDLKTRLQSALDRPVTRTIRVPISAVCPSQRGTEAAGVPQPADPGSGFVSVPDPGYGQFRDWLLHFGAGPSAGSGTASAVPATSP